MSAAVIIAIVILAISIVALVVIINEQVERRRVERHQKLLTLQARAHACKLSNERLPRQLMTAELKLVLTKTELSIGHQLQKIGGRTAQLDSEMAALERDLQLGKKIVIRNQPLAIDSEARLKIVRQQLHSLFGVVSGAFRDEVINELAVRKWADYIRRMAVLSTLEMYDRTATRELAAGKSRKALNVIERALAYIQKQPSPHAYPEQTEVFSLRREQLLELLEKLEHEEAHAINTLQEGVNQLFATESEWKKRAY